MPLYRHTSGEQVLTPEDSPEGRRLEASDAWSVVGPTEPPAKPRRRRGADGEDTDGQETEPETQP